MSLPPSPDPSPPAPGPGLLGTEVPASPGEWLRQRLFDQRRLVLSGTLDDGSGNDLCMELMTLDALGDGPVELAIDCGSGSTSAALAVMDVIDLLGVPVRGWCLGQAMGPVVGVLAVCSHRTLAAHARIRLVEPKIDMSGDAQTLENSVTAHRQHWVQFCSRLSGATCQPVDRVLADTAKGRFLSVDEALSYGLADEVAVAGAGTSWPPGRRLGSPPR